MGFSVKGKETKPNLRLSKGMTNMPVYSLCIALTRKLKKNGPVFPSYSMNTEFEGD